MQEKKLRKKRNMDDVRISENIIQGQIMCMYK